MKIRKNVFFPTVLVILVFLILYVVDAERFDRGLEFLNSSLNATFGGVYLIIALFLVIVSVLVLFSKMGKMTIGGEGAKPLLSTVNWFTVVLCTTIAAGLIFWGSSEPVFHLMAPPEFADVEPGTHASAVFSMTTMFLHWTITPYAIYGIPALMFAIAVYNEKKPFSFSSCISGVFPKAGTPVSASIIDSMCVFATVMGMIASLGQGILSIAGGITQITGNNSTKAMWTLIGVAIAIVFTLSACSGVLKGIKWISNINTGFLLALLVMVFLVGPTSYIVQLSLESFGVYVDNFFTRSLMIGAGTGSDWSYFWTISTFANWMAWAPITGMFLGKIAYGHSVRKFIAINIGAAAMCSGLWINVFGGTSIYQQLNGVEIYETMQTAGTESAVYEMLKALPFGNILIPLLVFAVALSVITAADSTTNVLGDLCCTVDDTGACIDEEQQGKSNKNLNLVKIVWGLLLGSMSVIMICFKGVAGVKMISMIGGLPAVILLLLSGIGLLKVTFRYLRE